MDASQIRFLESASNLRTTLFLRTGRRLSTTRAKEISACLQQGRQFFETSLSAPLEIRPLIEFYGLVGFSKALILAIKSTSLSALAASHGLRDVTAPDSPLAGLTAVLDKRGTFADFNDVAASLNRLCYIDEDTNPVSVTIPTTASKDIFGLRISLKEVLGRLAPLSKLYQYTFGEAALAEPLDYLQTNKYEQFKSIRIADRELITSRSDLIGILKRWRNRFPYLENWTVIEASQAWGESYITLANLARNGIDDLSSEALPETAPGCFVSPLQRAQSTESQRIPIGKIFDGIGGGYAGRLDAIAPLQGHYISEYSLIYIGLFLLGSLVRYRPYTWSHAISRSSLIDRPADDHALALIQSFLDLAQESIPSFVVKTLNPNEDGAGRRLGKIEIVH